MDKIFGDSRLSARGVVLKIKSNIYALLIASVFCAFPGAVQAQTPQMSDQQIQALKSQYLAGGGLKLSNDLKSSGSNKSDEMNKDLQAVQPQQKNLNISTQPQSEFDRQLEKANEPISVVEQSMRERLNADLKVVSKKTNNFDSQEARMQGEEGKHLATDPNRKNSLDANEKYSKNPKEKYSSNSNPLVGESGLLSKTPFELRRETERLRASHAKEQDQELRSAWERFLENSSVREVDSDISQYGYGLFSGAPSTFSPAVDIPVPPEYVLGPGDELLVQLYGSRDDTLTLVVDRNGVVELPKVGTLTVAGLSFAQAKAAIAEQISNKSVGVSASVTMGRLRSIRVFVLGDVEHPGSYLISGFSTMSHALFAAGGVSKSGSLRHIKLKRSGKTVNELDLYDFLLKGDSRGDRRLMAGDVVFVPPLGRVVGVAGKANRPAIYELNEEKTVQDVLLMAGGALSDADVNHMQIDRLEASGDRALLDVASQERLNIKNGDILMLFPIPAVRTNMVSLLGHAKRPGQYGWHKDMPLTELIKSPDDLLPGAFLDYALIQRTDPLTRAVSTVRVSLDNLLVKQDKQADLMLKPDDQVYIFSKSSIDPLNVVLISGTVVNPGQYPFAEPMKLLDLLFAAGGPSEDAYLKVAELTRYDIVDGERRVSSHFEVNLSEAMAGNANANVELKPHDELFVRTIANWKPSAWIELQGEVVHPGKYPVEEGERLSSVLMRAGGYTKAAYLRASFFTRESVRLDEQAQLDELARKTEAEVTKMEATGATLRDDALRARQLAKLENAKRIAEQLKSIKATGRVVVELDNVEKLKESTFDIAIRDGDKLVIPMRPDVVQVLGEVYNQTAFVYRPNTDSGLYLKMAGGATRTGDVEHFYVVRANGLVDVGSKGWFSSSVASVEPGDTIIVPQIIEQSNFLDATLDWSRVMMQVGVSLASMKTVGVFK